MTDKKEASPVPKSAGLELRPCVFLDRDGTITREAGYINHPERLVLEPGAAAAIRRLNRAGVLAVLVTNQAGLARGYFTEDVLLATFEHLKKLLAARGARLDAIYYAPHHPSSADPRWREDPGELRKPGLGMIRQACAELPIDMAQAYVIGDRYNDVTFAHKAGLPGIFIKTGYGLGEYTYQREAWKEAPDFIAENLSGAVKWVLGDLKKKGWKAKPMDSDAKRQTQQANQPMDLPDRPAEKIVTIEEAAAFARAAQAAGQTVVFANGCFDILHAGHVSYLNDAKAEGDVVIVGVNSDASERAIKGAGRPVMPGDERAELIAGMEAVDRVVIFEELTAERCLREIRPDVHAKGTDYSAETVPERAIAEELGIRVAITGLPKSNASKTIMHAIREQANEKG